ncbi:anion permease [Croceibacterium sp. LX-88]|uniref:Anion permease n=1 Tax=Croceibacterium selenioxidans TaxID=2838833 RepID=A0ABS5VZX2_9SPHN|nr:SLC13 family permease [Croceibacterium selenioxidans]MBT2133073.1 anion permease [Croceibacterium selenioxidans]
MFDLLIVLGLLLAAIVMFAIGRPRMDAVALLMMVMLPLSGIITVEQALAGFADPNIILIAALFVVGEALVRTGVAKSLGDWLVTRSGSSEARLIVLLMIVVAGAGSFMSSTGVVAIFVPIVLRIARNARIPAGRLMMPLSVAALLSGMMTLVATAPNLVIHAELQRHGLPGFGFFDFTPFGIPLLVLAVAYMLGARRFLGGESALAATSGRPTLGDFVERYGLEGREYRFLVESGSPLIGRALNEFNLRGSTGINVIAIERTKVFTRELLRPYAQFRLEAGDVVMIDMCRPDIDLDELERLYKFHRLPLAAPYFGDRSQEIGMAEVLLSPDSDLVGKTVVTSGFRTEHDLSVVGIRRAREVLDGLVADVVLRAGDTLLVIGPWRAIDYLPVHSDDLIVLNTPVEVEDVVPQASRAPYAVAILALTVFLLATGFVPNVLAALIGCLLFGLTRCIDMNSAYESIHWKTLVLIVGMLPFSIALEAVGATDIAAQWLLSVVSSGSLTLVLVMLFVVTAVLGLFISNTATAVLMAPIAIAMAQALGVSPYPLAMTVALAASAAFITPVSSPVNMLVVGPGNYRFGDFVRIGIPLTLIVLVVTVLLVPVILPF